MSARQDSGLPIGTTLYPGEGKTDFTLLSRGDRVSGTVYHPGSPTLPLVLACAPDGCSRSAWVDALVLACADFALVASIDLPLCGARTSEKLSEPALDPGHPLAARLRDELQAQTLADLRATLRALLDTTELRPSKLALAAAGIGADLALGFCRDAKDLAAIALAVPRDPGARQLADPDRVRVLDTTETEPVVEFLRSRLAG